MKNMRPLLDLIETLKRFNLSHPELVWEKLIEYLKRIKRDK